MKLYKKVKPQRYMARSKSALLEKITQGCNYTVGTFGSGYVYGSKFRMFNCHKIRRKRGLHSTHWIAYVYTFDETLLKALDIRVAQHNRNFEIKSL